jgi:hypothetical protein
MAGAIGQEIERLDKIYFCTKCKATFLFWTDVGEHMRRLPAHQDFVSVPFE